MFEDTYYEKVEKHKNGVELLKSISDELETFLNADNSMQSNIETSDISINIKLFLGNFKKTKNLAETLKTIKNILNVLKIYEDIPKKSNQKIKNVKKNLKIRPKYNILINKLHTMILNSSILSEISFIDNSLQLTGKKDPNPKCHIDILTHEEFRGQNPIILKLDYGRMIFSSKEDMLNCLLVYVEKLTPESLFFENIKNIKNTKKHHPWGSYIFKLGGEEIKFSLIIKFPHSQFEENPTHQNFSIIPSDSNKIAHYLLDGNLGNIDLRVGNRYMKNEDKIKYPHYSKYQFEVRKKIKQLISHSELNESFPYKIIYCIRTYPKICGKVNIVNKNSTQKKLVCQCQMELCTGGCCRIYHGETDCSYTFDQASEELVKTISDNCSCPNCTAPVIKFEGCNHITCKCNIEFCYVCKKEFEKDSYGRYKITEHYRDNDAGRSLGATCTQYN